jgi:hypothetical protein
MINLTKMLELTIAGRNDNTKLTQLEEMLKQYITEETVKSKGGNKALQRLTAGRKYLKESEKINVGRPAFSGSWMENGKQYMTNGHSGIELVSVIDGLNQIPEDVPPFKLLDIIVSADKNAYIKVEVPGITELKAQYKTAVAIAKGKGLELTGVKAGLLKVGKSIFNLKLFLDTISMFPEGELEYYVSDNRLAPVMIKDELGNRAIIMPLRITEEDYENAV